MLGRDKKRRHGQSMLSEEGGLVDTTKDCRAAYDARQCR
jgi:hypothetical protein